MTKCWFHTYQVQATHFENEFWKVKNIVFSYIQSPQASSSQRQLISFPLPPTGKATSNPPITSTTAFLCNLTNQKNSIINVWEYRGSRLLLQATLFRDQKNYKNQKKRQALLQVPHASISKLNSLYSALSPFSKKYLISGSWSTK